MLLTTPLVYPTIQSPYRRVSIPTTSAMAQMIGPTTPSRALKRTIELLPTPGIPGHIQKPLPVMPWSRSSKDSHNNPSMQVPGCRDGGKSRRTIGGRGTRIHSWRGKTFFLTYIPVIRKKAREARYTYKPGDFFLSCFLHPSIRLSCLSSCRGSPRPVDVDCIGVRQRGAMGVLKWTWTWTCVCAEWPCLALHPSSRWAATLSSILATSSLGSRKSQDQNGRFCSSKESKVRTHAHTYSMITIAGKTKEKHTGRGTWVHTQPQKVRHYLFVNYYCLVLWPMSPS